MANHVFSEYIAKFPKVNPKDSQCIDGYEKHLALISFTQCDHQDKDPKANYSGMRSLQEPGVVVIELEPDMKGLLQPLVAKNFNYDDEIECIRLQLDDQEPEEQYIQKISGWKIGSLGARAVEIKYWKYEMKIYDTKGPTIEYGWDFRKQKPTHT